MVAPMVAPYPESVEISTTMVGFLNRASDVRIISGGCHRKTSFNCRVPGGMGSLFFEDICRS